MVTYIVTIIAVWVISALVSLGAAPRGRQAEFFALTLLILGPLGVGFAAVAVPRDPEIAGRIRIVCPRCVAAQYVGTGVRELGCWRCDQRIAVDHWGRPSVTSSAAAPKEKAFLVRILTGVLTWVPTVQVLCLRPAVFWWS